MNAAAVLPQTTRNIVRLWADRVCVAIDLARVQGIERAERIQNGILRTQQAEWRILELCAALGQDATPQTRGNVVLLELRGERFGVRVDRVSGVSRVSVADLSPVPHGVPTEQQRFYTSVVELDGQPVLLLEPDALHPDAIADVPRTNPDWQSATPSQLANRAFVCSIGTIDRRAVGFILPAANVQELLDSPTGSLLPNPHSHARALLSWRNQALVQIDLATWCGVPALSQLGSRVAVVRLPNLSLIALNVGPTVRLLNLPLTHIASRRIIAIDANHVLGIFDTNEYTLIVPDLRKFCG